MTPVERIRLIPSSKLRTEQLANGSDSPALAGWRKSWILIARSAVGEGGLEGTEVLG